MRPSRTHRAREAWCFALTLAMLAGCTPRSGLAANPGNAGAVQVRTETLCLPYHTARYRHEDNPKDRKAFYPVKGTRKLQGRRDFQAVVLENAYLKVTVLPEIGGVVARAIHKPTGEDLFYWEGKAKNWLPWWESGVKVSFPFYEHGLGMDQPASHIIHDNADGSKTLAMYMEFSRHNQPMHAYRYGRYSNLLLSQHVTLHPKTGWFAVTYRVVNPGMWKQGLRLWNDTLLPRNQTEQGAVQGDAKPPIPSQTEWVFPAWYASDHGGKGAGPYDPKLNRIASRRDKWSYSVFAWDIRQGFAGLYYPTGDINRLRLFDPDTAPGTKQWYIAEGRYRPEGRNPHMYNFVELWGGTDSVFEGIENWIGPGEAYETTFRYTLVKGVGKVDYADEHLALGLADKTLKVLPFRPTTKLSVRMNGKDLPGPVKAGPETVASFPLPAAGGTFEIRSGQTVLFSGKLPLELPKDTSRHERIRTALKGRYNTEMRGNTDEWGNTYRKAIGQYPDGTLDKGRVLFRDGQLAEAIEHLAKALKDARRGDNAEATARIVALISAIYAESSKPIAARLALEPTAKTNVPAVRYWRGLLIGGLDDLAWVIRKNPNHWRARLLYAARLTETDADKAAAYAGDLVETDPASPQAWWVYHRALRAAEAEAGQIRQAETNLKALLTEPGAEKRLAEFQAAVNGKFVPAQRLGK